MIIIGEKINGAIPSVAQAIKDRNSDWIKDLAMRQAEAGADYLDVCAGTSPDVEAETLQWLIEIVEGAVDTPICIDSPDAKVIAAVLPYMSREGIVNSVSEERGKAELLYPLIAGSGWKVIALTCDDAGIPSSTEKKVEIADILIDKAKNHGIDEERIYVDTLVMALSAVGGALLGFTEALTRIRGRHPEVKFTSGLSNISYGTPARKLINRNFLTLALAAGMDSAIMDPTNADMYATVLAAEALLGRDRHCRKYNRAYRNGRFK